MCSSRTPRDLRSCGTAISVTGTSVAPVLCAKRTTESIAPMSTPCVKGSSQRGAFIVPSREQSECLVQQALHLVLRSPSQCNPELGNVRSGYPGVCSGSSVNIRTYAQDGLMISETFTRIPDRH